MIAKVVHKNSGNYIVTSGVCVYSFLVWNHMLGGVIFEGQKPDSSSEQMAVIPNAVDKILSNALSGKDSISEVVFTRKAFSLEAGVFSGCGGLKMVTLAPGMEKIPLEAFLDCGSLHTVNLPDSIQQINLNGFKNCVSLKNIRLPERLSVIEDAAFYGCHALKEISLPKKTTVLGNDAFADCTSLRLVDLPDSLETIGECAFMNCRQLEEIVIPPSVKKLPIGAFAGCNNLRRVVLPKTLESVSEYAFYGCCRLESVECENPERFALAWENTPFWKNRYPNAKSSPKPPMALLNAFAGKVSGVMLSALGYAWFDCEKEYRIFQTERDGVFRVETEPHGEACLMNGALEPISRE